MMPMYVRQILAVLRLELKKTFFARRGLWVYLVALAPAALYLAQDIGAPRHQQHLEAINQRNPVQGWRLANVVVGMSRQSVLSFVGQPYDRGRLHPTRSDVGVVWREVDRFTDGKYDVRVAFDVLEPTRLDSDGRVTMVDRQGPATLAMQSNNFATLFQNVYLRLGIFFGCIGIFANLFRGEMLDKSLHYYLLTPMRREILVAGKFLAGLLVMSVIFMCGTVLQFAAMLWQFDRVKVADFLHTSGSGMAWSYVGVTLLACVAYGSVFMALGLLFRNPIVPAAFVLMWESIVLFMPVTLKEASIIYYLQCLCPVGAQVDPTMPPLLKLLVTNDSAPVSHATAVAVLLTVSAVCLGIAAFRGRRLEINYGVE